MNNLLFSVNVVAPLFVLMLTGYIARKIRFVSEPFLTELNKFVFKFCLPIMLFNDIRTSYKGDFSNTRLIFTAVFGILIVIALSICIVLPLVKKKGQRGSIIQGVYRSNFLIYGLPLATGMYGQEAVATISMLMGIMIPLYNVAAVIILSTFSETATENRTTLKSILKEIVTNPLILGCFFGLMAGIIGFELPSFIRNPIAQFATIGTPLALFVMGGEFQFRYLGGNILKVISVTAARLIVVPLLAMSVFVAIGFRNVELSVLLSIFATPTTMASYIMSKNMGCDGQLSAQIVVLTTAASCLTIFLFIFVLKSMGYV